MGKRRFVKPAAAVIVVFAASSILLAFFLYGATVDIPSFQAVRNSFVSSEAVLLDRNGEVIHEMRVDEKGRRLEWAVLRDISDALQRAVIRSEDKRFYGHRGVDWLAMGAVLVKSATSGNIRGASTITMQLASILNKGLKGRNYRRTFSQKLNQIREAVEYERTWTKGEILEAYLNLASFRGELQGVSAAAWGLFGKDPHGMDDVESLILASLLRSPNTPAETAAQRAYQLGMDMGLGIGRGHIGLKIKEAFSSHRPPRPKAEMARHLAVRLLKNPEATEGERPTAVRTTIDAGFQRFAADSLKHHLLFSRAQNVSDGAVLVVENRTGDVLAYVGSSGEISHAMYVDGVVAKRQAGSTLKPFLYAFAFENRLITAASIIDDRPLDVTVSNGIYRPQNYDSSFKGLVTARTALASSLNVPAVKTLRLAGIEPFLKVLQNLGIKEINEGEDFYGPSLALGSADVSLWEMANAYRTLANQGVWSSLNLTSGENTTASKKRVFSKEAAFIVSDILSDREARSYTFGLESPLSTGYWSAVKTGTSKDMRDNWCIGYSDKFTVGVWVGNFTGEPMWNVSGITGAAPVWVEIMDYLHRERHARQKKPPAGLVSKRVEIQGIGDVRTEWFIKGTEPDFALPPTGLANFKIIYPAHDTLIARDPDIPEEQQVVFFESEPADNSLRWELNGKPLGAGHLIPWKPDEGAYSLTLIDREGRMLDSVKFEVRGDIP